MNTQHSPPPCMPSTPSNHIHPSLAIFRTSTGVPSKIPPDRFQQKGGHFLMVSKLSPLRTPHETIKIKPVWRVERMWAIKLEPAVAGACKKIVLSQPSRPNGSYFGTILDLGAEEHPKPQRFLSTRRVWNWKIVSDYDAFA